MCVYGHSIPNSLASWFCCFVGWLVVFGEPNVIQAWEFYSTVCRINQQMSPLTCLPVVNRFGHKDKMGPNIWSLLVLHKDVLGLSLDTGGQEQLPSLENRSLQPLRYSSCCQMRTLTQISFLAQKPELHSDFLLSVTLSFCV